MPKTTPPARYDLPWKAVITHAFHPFMNFYFPGFSARIDWHQRPCFLDKELAGFGIGTEEDVMVADVLIKVFLRDAPAHCANAALLEASDNPVAWLTLVHWRTQQTHHAPAKRYAAKLRLAKLLFRHRWKSRRIIILFNAMNWMMALPESRQRRFWQTILRLEKEHEMKLLNPLEQMFFDDGIKKGLKLGRQEGMQEGLEQGLELGRTEGAAALLERQLERRFGPLPKTARSKLAKASVAEVEVWSDALLTAQSLRQVFGAPR